MATAKRYYDNALTLTESETAATTGLLTTLFAAKVATGDGQPANHIPQAADGCAVDTCLRADGELARIAIALKMALCLRLWIVLRELLRLSGKRGFTWDELRAALDRYRIRYSEQNLKRWLHRGHGFWWQLDANTGLIYPAGYRTISIRLVEKCLANHLYALIATNRPGMGREMYIDVSSWNIKQFEAKAFASWYAYRENPTLSRAQLCALFRKDVQTLQAWERLGYVEVKQNYATYTLEHYAALPKDENTGKLRRDVRQTEINGVPYWEVRLPNTYIAPPIRQHDRKGASRQVSYQVRKTILSNEPAGVCEQSPKRDGVLNPNGRLYHPTLKGLRQHVKRHGERGRYLYRGTNGGRVRYYTYTEDSQVMVSVGRCNSVHDKVGYEYHKDMGKNKSDPF